MKKRIELFDYLRGAACIMVVLFHYTARYQELFGVRGGWLFTVPWGGMAVSVFFMLSGYLSISQHRDDVSISQYICKKISRLYPVYWIAVVLTYSAVALLLPVRSVSLGSAVINLTMLQSFVGVGAVDGAYWTLANELVFYAFIGLFVVGLKQKKRLPVFFLVWICALFGLELVHSDSTVFRLIEKILISGYGQMFMMGSSLGYVLYDKRSRWVSAAVIALCLIYQWHIHDLQYFIFTAVSLGLMIVGIWMHRREIAIPAVISKILKPVRFVAEISYPLYLIHQNIGYVIMTQLEGAGWTSEWIILVPILATGLLAYLLHRYVEVPAAKKMMSLCKRK